MRAQTYQQLGRWADAVLDWERVIELSSAPDRPVMQLSRAKDLARAGEHRRAAAAARALAETPTLSGELRCHLACVYALAIVACRADSRLSQSERDAAVESYGVLAVAVLRRVAAAHYFRDAANVEWLRKEPELDALRSRPDFKRLLTEVESELKKR
jgi:hypothetical protein